MTALAATASALLVASASSASLLASANFASYADGALVGQGSWAQYQTSATGPLTVNGGRVSWAGNGNTASNNQDAFLAFASQVTQPVTGTTVLNFDILLSISSAGTTPSYFAALNQNTTGGTSGNFQNVRMAAQASGAGYVFGTRVNGQGGYPFSYGTTVLNFGQLYALRAEISLVAGNANDFINLYVGSDFESLSHYATAGYGSGAVSDISVGAMLLSQFSSAAAFESGVSISSMSVSLVPTPGTIALLGVAGLVARRRR